MKSLEFPSDSTAYIPIMKDFVEHLIAKYNARVVILPNELSKGTNDDKWIAEEICAKVNNDRCDVSCTDGLLAQETKGIISKSVNVK
jgi:hypothetical protein